MKQLVVYRKPAQDAIEVTTINLQKHMVIASCDSGVFYLVRSGHNYAWLTPQTGGFLEGERTNIEDALNYISIERGMKYFVYQINSLK